MISIVVPTYNSEKVIEKLCEAIISELSIKFEIILVNDASIDNTKAVINNLQLKYDFIHIINLTKNIGQVGATLVGINFSKGEFIVTMDDDLQHQPRYINNLHNAILSEDVDVIVAKWKQDETLLRNVGSYIFSVLSSILILESINFRNTAFRILRREVKTEFTEYFFSRFWIDPRRLKVQVSQISVGHDLQNFRPYSSFKTRMLLAIKHFLIDTYLVQICTLILGFNKIVLSCITAIFFYLLQESIKRKVKEERLNFNISDS
jgi:glycosyltransferase involved in cell wall biosynthesis